MRAPQGPRSFPAVTRELRQNHGHLLAGKARGLAKLQRSPVHFRQRLDFHGERERAAQRLADRDHAVVGRQRARRSCNAASA